MVSKQIQAGLSEFTVEGNQLFRAGVLIASFPTPICEMARVNEKLFIALHPYPARQQPDYAGTNLWALDFQGNILWKAHSLNLAPAKWDPNSYRCLTVFDPTHPKIMAMTMDDHVNPIIDASTGQSVGNLGGMWNEEYVKAHKITEATIYLSVLPNDPPERSIPHALGNQGRPEA